MVPIYLASDRCRKVANSLFILPSMVEQVQHWRVTYNDIHNLIRRATPVINEKFDPNLMVAIGLSIFLFKAHMLNFT